jgi:integrase
VPSDLLAHHVEDARLGHAEEARTEEVPGAAGARRILSAHRARLEAAAVENPDLTEKGYMFPSSVGTLRTPNTLDRAWQSCLAKTKITKRFTVHGLRYTFTDLVQLANVDAVVRGALTGHVTDFHH